MNCIKTYLPLALVLLLVSLVTPSIPVVTASDSSTDPALYSNDWRNTGPPGGDVRGLVVDPSNPDRFYFGTLDGQIYTSSDAGKTWQLLYNFGRPGSSSITSLSTRVTLAPSMLPRTGTKNLGDSSSPLTVEIVFVKALN
jgi:hypothetical protein